MRLFLSLIAVLCFAPVMAQAQNIYLQPHEPTAPKPTQQRAVQPAPAQTIVPQQQAAPVQQAHPSPPPVSAQDELNSILNNDKPKTFNNPTDYANAYYGNCVKQEHPILKGEDLKLLCGCTSVKFAENMTPEQVRAMREDSAAGQQQRNRLLIFVYAPCMQTPIRALILDECMKSTPNKFMMKDQPATCKCLADGVSADLQKEAPRMIEESIRTNPQAIDPLATLLNSRAFENRQKYHSKVCIQKHGVGLGGFGKFLQ